MLDVRFLIRNWFIRKTTRRLKKQKTLLMFSRTIKKLNNLCFYKSKKIDLLLLINLLGVYLERILTCNVMYECNQLFIYEK